MDGRQSLTHWRCCRFEYRDRDFSRFEANTAVFRDSHERNGIRPHYHLFALDGGVLTGCYVEILGDTDYSVIFDFEFVERIPHRGIRTFAFFYVLRRLGPWVEVAIHKIGPTVRFVDIGVEIPLFFQDGDPSQSQRSEIRSQV